MLEELELLVDDARVGRLSHVPNDVGDEMVPVRFRKAVPLRTSTCVMVGQRLDQEDQNRIRLQTSEGAQSLAPWAY